jgi:hypothetical protein
MWLPTLCLELFHRTSEPRPQDHQDLEWQASSWKRDTTSCPGQETKKAIRQVKVPHAHVRTAMWRKVALECLKSDMTGGKMGPVTRNFLAIQKWQQPHRSPVRRREWGAPPLTSSPFWILLLELMIILCPLSKVTTSATQLGAHEWFIYLQNMSENY